MAFKVIDLPYAFNALEPHVSKKTLEVHHGKHYKKYVSTLNELVSGTQFEEMTLEDVLIETSRNDDAIFHNAAQAWNHEFYWNCMTPDKNKPSDVVTERLMERFHSVEDFKDEFSAAAASLFGSGWVWLVREQDGDLSIEALSNAGNPMTRGYVPLLVCDVWEHAYYLDYQNERAKYVSQFWKVVNWSFLESNLTRGVSSSSDGRRLVIPPGITAHSA